MCIITYVKLVAPATNKHFNEPDANKAIKILIGGFKDSIHSQETYVL